MTILEQEEDNNLTLKPKKDIKVIYFDLDLDNINLGKIDHKGNKIKGLAGILIRDYSQEENSQPKLYHIKFEGKIKKPIDSSEENEIIKDNSRKASRDSMRKMRGRRYKEQIAKYFPREELSNKLNEIFKDNTSNIEIRTLRNLIYTILNEKKPLTQKESNLIRYSPVLAKAIEEFMNTRDYFKTDGKTYNHKTGEIKE